jgi:hypothetical protein
MLKGAVEAYPSEPTYHVTLGRFQIIDGDFVGAEQQISQLSAMNFGGSLDEAIARLRKQLASARSSQ